MAKTRPQAKPSAWRRAADSLEELFPQRKGPIDYFDYNLLAAVILLTCFGLVMLYSTSAYKSSSFFIKQALISIASLVMLFVVVRMDYHTYTRRYSEAFYLLSLVVMFMTRFIGKEVNGAKRWIEIGPIQFQSAELAKLAVILYIPYVINLMGEKGRRRRSAFCVIAVIGGLAGAFAYIFTQNLSTGIIIIGIAAVLLFLVWPNWKLFASIGVGSILMVLAARVFVFPKMDSGDSFRLERILIWLSPEKYADKKGYQIMQALYALGSGGLFGKGLGNSVQKLGSLPEAQNDMIFAIICEELGVFGAIIVIGLFVFLLYRLYFIARHAPDLLGSLIVSGIFAHIALQVTLNIAVVTNFIPTTGITLPFISYGGTSVVFLMMEMAIALSVSMQIKHV